MLYLRLTCNYLFALDIVINLRAKLFTDELMDLLIPSRVALKEAEQINAANGHENFGFLSEKFGLLPINPPLLSMPNSHSAWDEIAKDFTKLYETVSIRLTFDSLPILDASEKYLEDKYVLRALTLLGLFAHGYYWLEATPPQMVPDCIMRPWQQISARVGRARTFLGFSETFFYNWKFVNPENPKRCVANMDLLMPTVNKLAEKYFYLGIVEMTALGTPLIGASVRAQEAVVKNDVNSLKKELSIMVDAVEKINRAYDYIDPNPYSRYFVDPVVWGKCIGIIFVSFQTGTKGASGVGTQFVHLLDAFIGRTKFAPPYGEDQQYYRQVHNSPLLQKFINALEKISVRSFVEKNNDPELKGLFYQLIDAYAGDQGFLQMHLRKAYGFLATTYKVGRLVTVGGAASHNPFVDREWDKVAMGFEKAIDERLYCKGQFVVNPLATVKMQTTLNKENSRVNVKRLILDVKNTGINYRPGDRCAVLPKNNDELIRKTLIALQANEKDTVHLNKAWRNILKTWPEFIDMPERIPLIQFLKYAKIRPLLRNIAQSLYLITRSLQLKEIIDTHTEDQWELWDILHIVSKVFEVRRLWQAEAWEKENISNIVPMENFRQYSISSNLLDKGELDLTIGSLVYKTKNQNEIYTRYGTASNYLNDYSLVNDGIKNFPVEIIKANNFKLPDDPKKPIVMFAGGTGISPFCSFIHKRLEDVSENWLFYGIRSKEDFYYQNDIEKWMDTGKLHVKVSVSDEDVEAAFDKHTGHFNFTPGKRGYISRIIEEEETAKLLWALLRNEDEGGLGAYFYVCGSGLFSDSIYQSLKKIVNRYIKDNYQAENFIYRMQAEKRYKQDIFTTFVPSAFGVHGYRMIDASEIAIHNNLSQGFWTIINDEVYDLSEFIHLHPGGDTIITNYAGIDGTREFCRVDHHKDTSISAMLNIYKIGAVKPLQFGSNWGITLTPDGLSYITLEEFYTSWRNYLYLVTEMQNIQQSEIKFYLTYAIGERNYENSWRYGLQSTGVLLANFFAFYFDILLGDKLQQLWESTIGFCAPQKNTFYIQKESEAIKSSSEYSKIKEEIGCLIEMKEKLGYSTIDKYFNSICQIDNDILSKLKNNLMLGLKLFEKYQQDIIENASSDLVNIIENCIPIFKEYLDDLEKSFSTIRAGK